MTDVEQRLAAVEATIAAHDRLMNSMVEKIDRLLQQQAAILAKLDAAHTPDSCPRGREQEHVLTQHGAWFDELFARQRASEQQIATIIATRDTGSKAASWWYDLGGKIVAALVGAGLLWMITTLVQQAHQTAK